jgi:hypothetical protein
LENMFEKSPKKIARSSGMLTNIGDFALNLLAKYVLKGIRTGNKGKILTLQQKFKKASSWRNLIPRPFRRMRQSRFMPEKIVAYKDKHAYEVEVRKKDQYVILHPKTEHKWSVIWLHGLGGTAS